MCAGEVTEDFLEEGALALSRERGRRGADETQKGWRGGRQYIVVRVWKTLNVKASGSCRSFLQGERQLLNLMWEQSIGYAWLCGHLYAWLRPSHLYVACSYFPVSLFPFYRWSNRGS